ncbi:hypothetical protein ACP70R_007986 [Stipagrostis hirtigluma subsp. patula]
MRVPGAAVVGVPAIGRRRPHGRVSDSPRLTPLQTTSRDPCTRDTYSSSSGSTRRRCWRGAGTAGSCSPGTRSAGTSVCMLAGAVAASGGVYEQSGKPISRHKGYLSMVFADYNLSVEYYRAPMIVRIDRVPAAANGN